MQLGLWDVKPKRDERWVTLFGGCDPKLYAKFVEYNTHNPHLWELFVRFSLEAKNKGRKRFSIWMIANRIRWYTAVETTGKEFKVSNDFLALYARKLVYEHPELNGLFQFKVMKKHRTSARD